MIARHLIAGLCTLGKYDSTGNTEIQPGHDVLYVGGPPPADMADDDVSALKLMNFHYDEVEETWAVFT